MKKIRLLLIIFLILFVVAGYFFSLKLNPSDHATIINQDKIITKMYLELSTTINSEDFLNVSKSELYIEEIIMGSFTEKNKDELLVVLRINNENLPHAAGFYHAYMCVFDNESGELSSKVMHFMADEGQYKTYRGNERDYLFFTGAVIYQGYAERKGGLYKVGPTAWEKAWPDDDKFWGDHAVDIRSDGLRVMKMKPKTSGNQVLPEIEWEFDYYLKWNAGGAAFIEQGFE